MENTKNNIYDQCKTDKFIDTYMVFLIILF